MQNIAYNVSNNPVSIKELNAENIDFEYNAFGNRATMYYGGLQALKADRPYRKYYSADGTMEIKRNVISNTVEFVTYIGGDAYTAPVVLKSDGATNEFLYLHRDYQKTIVGISNSSGALVEKRWFDVWGSLIRYSNGSGVTTIPTVSTGLLLDRGYTRHEHLLGVNIINMNGRIYDDKLHRFLQPDNDIQDPYNTQNFNRYGYVMNNPTKYSDPSGENFFIGYLVAALLTSYVSGVQSSGGEFNPLHWNSNGWTNAGLNLGSLAASVATTELNNNYINNYNNKHNLENITNDSNSIETHGYVIDAKKVNSLQTKPIPVFSDINEYLERENYLPYEEIDKMDESYRETYIKRMIQQIVPAKILDKYSGSPQVNYAPNLIDKGATNHYGISIGPKAFVDNRSLILTIIHEYSHAWDIFNGYTKFWGINARSITETRAYEMQRWFSGGVLDSVGQQKYDVFSELAKRTTHNYKIQSYRVFFINIQK